MRSKAYTLTEVLICILIIIVLFSIVISILIESKKNSYKVKCLTSLRSLTSSITLYSQDYDGRYPPVVSGAKSITNVGSSFRIRDSWYFTVSPYLVSQTIKCPNNTLKDLYGPELKKSIYVSGYTYNQWVGSSSIYSIQDASGVKFYYEAKDESQIEFQSNIVLVCEARVGIISLQRPDDLQAEIPGVHVNRIRNSILKEIPGAKRHRNSSNYCFIDNHCSWKSSSELSEKCRNNTPCFHQ